MPRAVSQAYVKHGERAMLPNNNPLLSDRTDGEEQAFSLVEPLCLRRDHNVARLNKVPNSFRVHHVSQAFFLMFS